MAEDSHAVSDAQVDRLIEAAEDGVARDGLVVVAADDGYRFETPGDQAWDLDEDGLRDLARDHAAHVTNWYFWSETVGSDRSARMGFLRWIESADDHGVAERYAALDDDGLSRTWGELQVTARLDGNGRRRYDLRHEDDAGVDVEGLDVHEDPLDAREIAKFDERDRYRPLKTAPSLADGWVFPDLGPHELVDAVDFFYPATVANWHREREDELAVDHWTETAQRQTGIYDVIDELDREAVEWIAEACCVDSQCLKRREWEYDEDHDLDSPAGDGEFPCREPCSLVIAASRKWTKLEEEETRTYEFELTPSEKEQVEGIVEAVADGRVGEIREADVYEDANRYRARYLRAKRFDDEGELSGVPTDDS